MTDAPTYDEPVSIVLAHDSRTVDTDRLTDLVHTVLDGEGRSLRHVSVVCADHETVRRLNREYLDHDYNTDVLSFSLAETDEAVEGEVYVDLDTAAERHDEFDTSYEVEVARYVAHGLLHLVGYDDGTASGNQKMHKLEDEYLQHVGLGSVDADKA
ncbi:rRNA maturation RNase YbeY [Longibacter sp.]|uniref:rRNA maturation RNase YbeY n=1 Tax=Longibacter sp. TaxID=2045415 RepID=UPI003EC0B4FE